MRAVSSKAPSRAPLFGSDVRSPGRMHEADRGLFSGALKVEWTLLYVGFLGYVFVRVTYALPLGDACLALALGGLLIQRNPLRIPVPLIFMALWYLWCVIGLFSSPYPDVVRETLILLAKLWIIALIGINAVRTRGHVWFFLMFFLAWYMLYPVRGSFINYFITDYSVWGRAVWNEIYANPNDLAGITFLPLSMAIAVYLGAVSRWTRRAALITAIVLPILILLTQSRGAFIALVACAAIAFMGSHRKLQLVVILGVLLAASTLVIPASAWDRLAGVSKLTSTSRLEKADPEGSAKLRFETWKVAINMYRSSPVFGVGLGAYPHANVKFALHNREAQQGKRDAHSTYLTLLAENGVAGLVLFMAMIGYTLRRSIRVRRAIRTRDVIASEQLRFLEIGLIAYLMAGIFGTYALISFLYIHLIIIWALTALYEREYGLTAAVRPRVARSARRPLVGRYRNA